MADGAVQIWESLLARSPASPLRPLILYRLGWAYRDIVTTGFPRGSSKAFKTLEREFPDSPYVSLAREARRVAWKSQHTATALSIVPGLGQIYVRKYASGTARIVIALVGAAMVVVPSVVAYQRRSDLTWNADWPLLATGVAGAVIFGVDYSLSYDDVLRSVLEFNDRAEDEFDRRHPDAP
jgi:hypothetical protein